MKNQFIIILLLINLAACSVFQPSSRSTSNLTEEPGTFTPAKKSQPVFINNISTDPSYLNSGNSVKTGDRPLDGTPSKTKISPESTDYYEQLQFKYAILTNTLVG